jgi:hypothetical protein
MDCLDNPKFPNGLAGRSVMKRIADLAGGVEGAVGVEERGVELRRSDIDDEILHIEVQGVRRGLLHVDHRRLL